MIPVNAALHGYAFNGNLYFRGIVPVKYMLVYSYRVNDANFLRQYMQDDKVRTMPCPF